MSVSEASETKPRVLLLYFTYTGQALKVLEAAAEVFRARGCEVTKAGIEFTDKRYAKRFSQFPMRHAFLDVIRLLPAQLRRATGEIRTPDEVRDGDYDLICIGSGTWWLTMNMPMRSFLKSEEAGKLLADKPFAAFVVCRHYWKNNLKTVRKLGEKQGGRYVDGIHFTYPGGQVTSLASLISYLGSGEYRDRYMGLKIPTTNIQPDQLEETRAFANNLTDSLGFAPQPAEGTAVSGDAP
jgi:menaquinone-dependent protoporphyrinogen IX oxidase